MRAIIIHLGSSSNNDAQKLTPWFDFRYVRTISQDTRTGNMLRIRKRLRISLSIQFFGMSFSIRRFWYEFLDSMLYQKNVSGWVFRFDDSMLYQKNVSGRDDFLDSTFRNEFLDSMLCLENVSGWVCRFDVSGLNSRFDVNLIVSVVWVPPNVENNATTQPPPISESSLRRVSHETLVWYLILRRVSHETLVWYRTPF